VGCLGGALVWLGASVIISDVSSTGPGSLHFSGLS
jgi:hypothetical protein